MTAAVAQPVAAIVDRHGRLRHRPLDDREQTALWATALHGGEGYVEVVAGRRRPDGSLRMRSRHDPAHFPVAGDTRALVALVAGHRQAGDEVFATPIARRKRRPGKAGDVLAARTCWVDLDDPEAVDRLRAFAHRPHLVVYSGSGGAHAYWRLSSPLEGAELEAVNRRLAHHLGGDLSCTDRARIMRVAGTHNHKAGRPCRLAYVDLAAAPIDARWLAQGLADPHPPAPTATRARRRRAAGIEADDAARIDPPSYFAVLARRDVPERGGHVPCPLPDHREEMASCMVYATAERGWRCYGCGRGGTVYDLASLLEGGPWGRELRGEAFLTAKRRVHEALGLRCAGTTNDG